MLSVRRKHLALVLSIAVLTAGSGAQTPRTITFKEIAHPKPGEWPTYNGLLSANRHSALDRITTQNVGTLAPAWTHEMGGGSDLQMTPIMGDGVRDADARQSR